MPSTQKTKSTPKKAAVKSGGIATSSSMKWKILTVALIVVVTAVGYVGYGKWKEHSLKAHAATWKTVYVNVNGVKVTACRNYVAAYGGIYQPQFLIDRGAWRYTTSVGMGVFRNGKYISGTLANQWWGGTAALVNGLNVSIAYNDTVHGSFYTSGGTSGTYLYSQADWTAAMMASWPAC